MAIDSKIDSKTVRIGKDPAMLAFAKKQKSFSKSIQILVRLYIQEVGEENIKDLWQEFEFSALRSMSISGLSK